jgi:mRNA (guanine-N7-)-methyltransferase
MEEEFIKPDINNLKNFMKEFSINDIVKCINGKDSNGEYFRVKNPPHNFVKDEFNIFVNKEISHRRKNSSISEMRKFHNNIKRTMLVNISKILKGDINLLDIAVGRGGDMYKWNEAGIKNVFGFDKNENSINSIDPFDQGAKERYAKSQDLQTNIYYTVGNAIQPSQPLLQEITTFTIKYGLFKIISCQFAMHYFFQDEIGLRNVFQAFTPFLEKGGYFIGTTVDGDKIKSTEETSFKLMEIKKLYKSKNPRKKFGNAYTFKINDTIDKGNYFNSTGISTEYLVYMSELKRIASEYNLEPVYLNLFEKIPGTKLYTTSNDFISFEQINNILKNKMNEDELIINNLYTTFIFIKR